MFGAGKLLQQAKKMQEDMEALQKTLADTVIEVSSGGGAIQIAINGQGEFSKLSIDPEFLKEEPSLVSETLLAAIQDATHQSKSMASNRMKGITAGLNIPGLTS